MTQTWSILIVIIPLLMGNCSQTSVHQNSSSDSNEVFLNGKKIILEEDEFQKLNLSLSGLLNKCDDFYEQIVTDELVDKLRATESFLEVLYVNKTEMNIGNKQTLTISRLFIPLSGKYQSNNELTFFCGNPGYSIQPYINSQGFEKLDKVLQKLISK